MPDNTVSDLRMKMQAFPGRGKIQICYAMKQGLFR